MLRARVELKAIPCKVCFVIFLRNIITIAQFFVISVGKRRLKHKVGDNLGSNPAQNAKYTSIDQLCQSDIQ